MSSSNHSGQAEARSLHNDRFRPVADVWNGPVYVCVAQPASKKNLGTLKSPRPQSLRDEDQKVDLEEINLLRQQSILPTSTKTQ